MLQDFCLVTSPKKNLLEHKLSEMLVPPRGDYVAVTWTALPSAFPLYCLLFHMCPEARQSTNTIHCGII
jgi:hypothetical protein